MSMAAGYRDRSAARAVPAHRNRVVEGLRAFAMVGVVLGHWLVTGLATDPDGGLNQQSPLRSLPMFTPLSWVLQTLGLFFFVAGYAAASSRTGSPRRSSTRWPVARMRRLLQPVAGLLAVWLLADAVLRASHVSASTRHTLGHLMISPLWFVLVLAVLAAVTPAVCAAEHRVGPALALVPLALTASIDLARYAVWPEIPDPLTYLNGVTGWLVPYVLGMAVAHGHLCHRATGAVLLVIGAAGGSVLVVAAGYPASVVGVPGAGRSNLDPPSLLTVALSLAQVGLALLAWSRLSRLIERPPFSRAVAVLNQSAMTVFLWHQTALLVVTGIGHTLLDDPVGLIGSPTDASWVWGRLSWLPAFVAVLAALWLLFRRIEHPADRHPFCPPITRRTP